MLIKHTRTSGHFYQCECDVFFVDKSTLTAHQALEGCQTETAKQLIVTYHHPHANIRSFCGVCVDKFVTFPSRAQRDQHMKIEHKACPTCFQIFNTTVERDEHQKIESHCCCVDQCNEYHVFGHLKDLANHIRDSDSNKSFDCMNCKDGFNSQNDLDTHLITEAHDPESRQIGQLSASVALRLAHAEELNLWCEDCNHTFSTVVGLKHHKASSKHKAPLFGIKCACGKEFSLVSAMLCHLESNTCRGGITRNKLNALVYRYDLDRHVTFAVHDGHADFSAVTAMSHTSIAPRESVSNLAASLRRLSLGSDGSGQAHGRILDLDDSDGETVTEMEGVINYGVSELCQASISESIGAAIPTPHSSITSSKSSVGGGMLTPSASSSEGGIYTPGASSFGDEGVILTPSASTSNSGALSPTTSSLSPGGVMLTPSVPSLFGGSGEWSFLDTSRVLVPSPTSIDGSSVSTLRFDSLSKTWPCPICHTNFSKKIHLQQHMTSPVHSEKLFHCPRDLTTTSAPGPDRNFRTLSGLVQHIEDGDCVAGAGALGAVVQLLRGPIQKRIGAKVELLEGGNTESEEDYC